MNAGLTVAGLESAPIWATDYLIHKSPSGESRIRWSCKDYHQWEGEPKTKTLASSVAVPMPIQRKVADSTSGIYA